MESPESPENRIIDPQNLIDRIFKDDPEVDPFPPSEADIQNQRNHEAQEAWLESLETSCDTYLARFFKAFFEDCYQDRYAGGSNPEELRMRVQQGVLAWQHAKPIFPEKIILDREAYPDPQAYAKETIRNFVKNRVATHYGTRGDSVDKVKGKSENQAALKRLETPPLLKVDSNEIDMKTYLSSSWDDPLYSSLNECFQAGGYSFYRYEESSPAVVLKYKNSGGNTEERFLASGIRQILPIIEGTKMIGFILIDGDGDTSINYANGARQALLRDSKDETVSFSKGNGADEDFKLFGRGSVMEKPTKRSAEWNNSNGYEFADSADKSANKVRAAVDAVLGGNKADGGSEGGEQEGGSEGDKADGGSEEDEQEGGSEGDKADGGSEEDEQEGGSEGDKADGGSEGGEQEGGSEGDKADGGSEEDEQEGGSEGDKADGGSEGDKADGGSEGGEQEGGSEGDKADGGSEEDEQEGGSEKLSEDHPFVWLAGVLPKSIRFSAEELAQAFEDQKQVNFNLGNQQTLTIHTNGRWRVTDYFKGQGIAVLQSRLDDIKKTFDAVTQLVKSSTEGGEDADDILKKWNEGQLILPNAGSGRKVVWRVLNKGGQPRHFRLLENPTAEQAVEWYHFEQGNWAVAPVSVVFRWVQSQWKNAKDKLNNLGNRSSRRDYDDVPAIDEAALLALRAAASKGVGTETEDDGGPEPSAPENKNSAGEYYGVFSAENSDKVAEVFAEGGRISLKNGEQDLVVESGGSWKILEGETECEAGDSLEDFQKKTKELQNDQKRALEALIVVGNVDAQQLGARWETGSLYFKDDRQHSWHIDTNDGEKVFISLTLLPSSDDSIPAEIESLVISSGGDPIRNNSATPLLKALGVLNN